MIRGYTKQGDKISIRNTLLILFSTPFLVWQMGIIYFSGTTLSMFGRTPILLADGDTIMVIALGYLCSILFICLFPRKTVAAERVLLPFAFVATLGMFFTSSPQVVTWLFYVTGFVCVFSIGNMISLAVHLFTTETLWRDGIMSIAIGGVLVAILQNDICHIPFAVFNGFSLLLIAALMIFHLSIPCKISCEYVSRKNPIKMPKILFIGIWLLNVFSTMLFCFANSFSETVPHGISVLYVSAAVFAILMWCLRCRYKEKSVRIYGMFFAFTVFAFVLAILSLHTKELNYVVCVCMGFVVTLANIWGFLASVSFELYPTRFIGALGAAVGMVLGMIHAGMLEMLRSNLRVLYGVYAVIAVAMMIAYYFVESYFIYTWYQKKRSDERKKETTVFDVLSEQEQILADLILQGYVESTIAEMMNISINTQKSYRKHLYTKLDIHSKRELFELATKEKAN